MKYAVAEDPNEKWFDKAKRKIKTGIHNGLEWISDNKEVAVVVIPIVVGGVVKIVQIVGKSVNLHKEEELKENYCYDRSLGHYWELRRKLSNDEWTEIDQRKKNGERLGDILNELHVLK